MQVSNIVTHLLLSPHVPFYLHLLCTTIYTTNIQSSLLFSCAVAAVLLRLVRVARQPLLLLLLRLLLWLLWLQVNEGLIATCCCSPQGPILARMNSLPVALV